MYLLNFNTNQTNNFLPNIFIIYSLSFLIQDQNLIELWKVKRKREWIVEKPCIILNY